MGLFLKWSARLNPLNYLEALEVPVWQVGQRSRWVPTGYHCCDRKPETDETRRRQRTQTQWKTASLSTNWQTNTKVAVTPGALYRARRDVWKDSTVIEKSWNLKGPYHKSHFMFFNLVSRLDLSFIQSDLEMRKHLLWLFA